MTSGGQRSACLCTAPLRVDASRLLSPGAYPDDDLTWRVLDVLGERLSACLGIEAHPVVGGLVLGVLSDGRAEGDERLATAVYAILGTGLRAEVGVEPVDAHSYTAALGERSRAIYRTWVDAPSGASQAWRRVPS